MKENVIPVIIKVDENCLYRIMNITYGNDGSLYFTFPKKEGFVVKKAVETEYSDVPSKRKISFKEFEKEYNIPKLSFHPRNFTVHLKSSDNETILGDYSLYNFSNDDGCFLCPVFQMGCPSIPDFFDEYGKKKYAYPLIIDVDGYANNITILCVVHSQEYLLEPELLDEMVPNRDKSNPVFCTVKISTNTPFTVTLFFTGFKNESNEMILAVNTTEQFVVYSFE